MRIYKAYYHYGGEYYGDKIFTTYEAAKTFLLMTYDHFELDRMNSFGIICLHHVGEEFLELKSYDYYPQLDGRTCTPKEYFDKFNDFNF